MEELIECLLMNKNTPVLKLKGYNKPISNTIAFPVFYVQESEFINRELCPICIFLNDEEKRNEQINHWLLKRGVSESRLGLPPADLIQWQDSPPHYFSFSDQYWIKYTEEDSWNKLNFFTNDYSPLTGDVIFSKSLGLLSPGQSILLNYHSPDITTNGVLKKRWTKDEYGNNILVKHMSKEFEQEPLSEILASKLLTKLKLIKFVTYRLYIEGYDLCCACKNFITPNTEFVPAKHIYAATPMTQEEQKMSKDERIYPHLMKSIEQFNIPHAEKFIDDMIIVDRMMFNMDRHLGNFGFIRDVETGKFIEPAPLFDFGNAFFPISSNMENKCFSKRENYLFGCSKIKPLDLGSFRKEIEECSFISDKKKDQILLSLNKNNEYITKKLNGETRHPQGKDNVQTIQYNI